MYNHSLSTIILVCQKINTDPALRNSIATSVLVENDLPYS
jgi:hypothetical protein